MSVLGPVERTAAVNDFVQSLNVDFWISVLKDQLLKLSEHSEVDVSKQGQKEAMQTPLRSKLGQFEFLTALALFLFKG